MQTFGVIGYMLLIFLTITWAIGIRTRFGTLIPTCLVGLMFLLFSIAIIFFDLSYIYSWLFIGLGYLSSFLFMVIVVHKIPLVSPILIFIGSIYANLIRIGIPQEKFKKLRDEELKKDIDDWAERKKERTKTSL